MRSSVRACGVALLVCAAARTADSPAQVLFNRVRENVRAALERVPRYTCVQTITRKQYRPQYGGRLNSCAAAIAGREQVKSPGLMVWHDRLRLDVAVGEKAEMFSYAGARRFETGSLADLALSGSTGSGGFSSFLASVFGPDAESFRYIGEKEISLGKLAAYTYMVPLAKSHYSYGTGDGTQRIVPFSGTFYAAPVNAELKRLVIEATQFPSGEVCRVVDTMDYHKVTIGSGEFLLPEVSTMEVLYREGQEDLNETRYSGCHEFTGESTIRFDVADEAGGSATNTAKAELQELPAKTRIRVKIDPPINTDTAAAGDAIIGVVEHEVKAKGQVVVKTSDRLHGRLLRLEQFVAGQPRWVVAIRFDSIERDGVEQEVSFKPLDDGDRSPQAVRGLGRRGGFVRPDQTGLPERPKGAGIFVFSETGRLVLGEKFHSEWETR